MHTYLHRLPENGSDLDVHPLPRSLLPVQVLLKPVMIVFNRLQVAEAHIKAVVVGGEGVDRVALNHVPALGALELPNMGEPLGHAHALVRFEAVPEHVFLVFEEGESFGTFLNFDLRTLLVLVHDEPDFPRFAQRWG